MNLLGKTREGKIKLVDAKDDQIKFKSQLCEIKKRNKKTNQRSKKTLEILYKARKNVIELKQGTMLINFMVIILQWFLKQKIKQPKEQDRILTSKQMLQRLPIALAQVKAGKNSKNSLNEIRQIVYYLYQLKKISKKI